MKRKLLAFVTAAAMFLTFAPVTSASGGTWNDCRSPGYSSTMHPTWHVFRNVSGRAYTYAIGTTTVQALHACEPSNGYDQFSVVMTANLQDYGQCFMQIGYGDGDGSGTLHYFASSDSLGTGNVTSMSLGFSPAAGDVSTFSIFTVVSGGQPYWELRVTKGGTYGYRLISQNGCGNTMPEAWYGIETHNYGDQFGGNSNPHLTAIHDLGYKYVGGPAATTWLQGTGNVAWAASPNTIPVCWHPGVSQDSGTLYTRLYGYTDCRP